MWEIDKVNVNTNIVSSVYVLAYFHNCSKIALQVVTLVWTLLMNRVAENSIRGPTIEKGMLCVCLEASIEPAKLPTSSASNFPQNETTHTILPVGGKHISTNCLTCSIGTYLHNSRNLMCTASFFLQFFSAMLSIAVGYLNKVHSADFLRRFLSFVLVFHFPPIVKPFHDCNTRFEISVYKVEGTSSLSMKQIATFFSPLLWIHCLICAESNMLHSVRTAKEFAIR